MYRLEFSVRFKKSLKRLTIKNSRLRRKTLKALELLTDNPQQPSLRLHKLSGTNNWSVSVDLVYRIIFQFEADHILITSFGSHDEVY